MNKVTFPLRIRMRRPAVADLHAALVALGFTVSRAERDAQRFGTSTRDAVAVFQKKHELKTTLEVDKATATKINELLEDIDTDDGEAYVISGRVVRSNGEPVKGAKIELSRRGITKDTPIADESGTKTDAEGRFELEYPAPDAPFDLGVELVADSDLDIPENRSRTIGNAGPDEHVTFVVGDQPLRGPSSFEGLVKRVGSALAVEGVEPAELADFDKETVARLSLRTGKAPRELVLLRQAYAVARETGLDAAVLYGMGKAGKLSIASKAALLAQDPDKRRDAVEAALAANDIPAGLEARTAEVLDKLDELAVNDAITNPEATDITSLGTLLEAADIPEDKRRKLAARYVAHAGDPQTFWKDVSENGELTESEIARTQLELQLAVATHNHAPLGNALKREGVGRLEDLGRFDRDRLVDLIRDAGLPADLDDAGVTEEEYADRTFRLVEDAMPTAMVAARADRMPEAERIKAFLDHNTDYDLRTTPIHTYLAANPAALDFADEPAESAAVTRAMKAVERAYRIAAPGDRIATVEVLLADGLDSAHKVRSLGRAAFVRRYAPKLGGDAAAERVFRRANNAAALSAILAARHAPAFNGTPFYALPNPELPELVDFFGSQDFCSCEHCQSVFGPAAYLVDILHWLEGRPSSISDKTALDVLFEGRRADIGGVELSCDNTNTPLPAIDLVNETLELLVAPPQGPVRYQATGTAATLRAHPEHLRGEAYVTLSGAATNAGADAVYPFDLPFDLWLDEARIYIGQLGVSRDRVMEQLLGFEASLSDGGVAIERLGMSPLEWDIIAGQTNPQRELAELWGLPPGTDLVATLSVVSSFLDRARIGFDELTELLRADVIQRPSSISVAFTGSSCDTETASLVGLTDEHLSVSHRFIRLRRRLGWSALDLDRAISILGGGVLDAACLEKLAHLTRLASETDLPVSELLTWWGPVDTRRWRARLVEQLTGSGFELRFDNQLSPRPARGEDASPYDRRFLDPSITVDPSGAFEINASGDELAAPVADGLEAQLTPIAAALGAGADDLAELAGRLGQTPDLDLANLSALLRQLSLARNLGLTARDLAASLALIGIDPFAGPDQALAFVREVRAIRASKLSVGELDYLLRHQDARPKRFEPDDSRIGALLFDIGAGLRAAETEHPMPDPGASADELRQALAQALGRLLAPEDVDALVAVVDIELAAGQTPPAGAAQLLDDTLAPVIDVAAVREKLAVDGPSLLRGRRARLEALLAVVARHLVESAKAAAAIERLSSATSLEPATTAALLRHLSLLELFSDDAVRDQSAPEIPARSTLPVQFDGYKLLDKAARILGRLGIAAAELGWVLEHGPTRGTLDLRTLPIAPTTASSAYGPWRRLANAVRLRDQMSPPVLFDLFDTTDPAALLDELAVRTGWNRADLEFLAGALGFPMAEDWRDERPVARLGEVMQLVARVGLSAEAVWGWRTIAIPAGGTPGELRAAIDDHARQATELKLAARAKHGETRWLEIAPGLRDPLRERQRDALASWLIGNPRAPGLAPFADAGALFDHLLIDTEISACQLTSRVKQAISATQLFVQRALLGLEPDLELTRADAQEWRWRKSYRVWEANRKIFLYPENYLEPELRDDKTPLFVDLESQLLQGEVTAENAEAAVRGYLEKLDEIARLEIVGLCEQADDGADILHVFGRTRGVPPTYYHRQRVGFSWSPWEKIDAGIEGDHLIPVVFNRRLYLFWAMINEAAIEEPPPHIPALPDRPQASRPLRYYEIHLAWTQLRDSGWAPKKVATDYIGRDLTGLRTLDGLRADVRADDLSSAADFFFRPLVVNAPAKSPSGQDLIIEPIRYRPSRVAGHARIARMRGDGPGGFDNGEGGFEPPPPPPPDDPPDDPPDFEEAGYYLLPRFRLSGCDDTVTLEPRSAQTKSITLPPATVTAGQSFARFPELSQSGELAFPAPSIGRAGVANQRALTSARPPFQVVPVRMNDFRSARPFFFQDQRRTFLVEPRSHARWVRQLPDWVVASKMTLEPDRHLPEPGERPVNPALDPWEYDSELAISIPPAIAVDRPAHSTGLASGSGAALAASLGSRVAFISGVPVADEPTRFVLGSGTTIVDRDGGDVSAGLAPRGPAAVARELTRAVVSTTHVLPELAPPRVTTTPPLTPRTATTYRFDPFYHPFTCLMRRQLNRFGLDGLFAPSPSGPAPGLVRQSAEQSFFATYGPTSAVREPRPMDRFDFSPGGAYSIYNWEVFFHVPFRVACQLSQNQRFAEAQRWFHYIFDPTETEGEAPRRFWKVNPLAALFNNEADDTGPVAELLLLLQYDGSDPARLRMRDELVEQVAAMRADPFNPHALARLRLAVYARAVVMRYIDNLIDWGDHLFRRDTIESINEATQLYVLAAQLLGRRPREVARADRPAKSFDDLRAAGIDAFGNALLEEIEGMLPEITESGDDAVTDDIDLLGGTLFFCVPPNPKLLVDYWGRVADRLFKIRHCMNIEGTVRQLPLFEPPIDPSLLVRARAAGVDLGSALSDLGAPLPCYRYRVLSPRAFALCADVRELGQALLSAMEKRDAEKLALLRAGHQVRLEDALIDVRRMQVTEAKESLEALRRSKESAELRHDYYRSRSYMNAAEIAQLGAAATAGLLDALASGLQAVGSIAGSVPDAEAGGAGFGGSPVVTFTFGGTQLSLSTRAASESLRINAQIADRLGQLSGLIGSYDRRSDDWSFQGDLAGKDIEVLERQIVAAEIALAVAESELANLELQLEQSREVEAMLRDKYTNVEIYEWMVGQLSALHFQAYRLAFDLARRAERAWQFELHRPETTFIHFGYWDNLKKGLLAGERLQQDLARMDVAYLEANRREYELVRHVSLRELDAGALLRLRRDGHCQIDIPEEWFDLATPGHYLRRLKTVSLSLPSVIGPYVSVPCTLTLEGSRVRTTPDPANPAFRDDLVAVQSIVTSQAFEDTGLFETRLDDDRYLPFEGAGAASRWRLELPSRFRSFDYETISDAILHIRYTAREGGPVLRADAEDRVAAAAASGTHRHLVSARADFPDAWASFLAPPQAQTDQTLSLPFNTHLFPYPWRRSTIRVASLDLVLVIDDPAAYASGDPLEIDITTPDSSSSTLSLPGDSSVLDGLPRAQIDFAGAPKGLGTWAIAFRESTNTNAPSSVVSTRDGHLRLGPGVRDLLAIIHYVVS